MSRVNSHSVRVAFVSQVENDRQRGELYRLFRGLAADKCALIAMFVACRRFNNGTNGARAICVVRLGMFGEPSNDISNR